MTKKNSRVVHVRIDDSVIYNALVLWEMKNGEENGPPPFSTAISALVASVVSGLVERGVIAAVSNEDATNILDEITKGETEANAQDVFAHVLDSLFPAQEIEREVEANILQHDDPVPAAVQEPPLKFNDDSLPKLVLADTAPWNELFVEDFPSLITKAPKDAILSTVDAMLPSPDRTHLERCLQVIYSGIPTSQWGTEKAKALLQEVSPTIKSYEEAGYE